MPGIFVRGGSAHIQGAQTPAPMEYVGKTTQSQHLWKIQSTREWVSEQEINHKIESDLHSTSVQEISLSPAPAGSVVVQSPVGLRSQGRGGGGAGGVGRHCCLEAPLGKMLPSSLRLLGPFLGI